MEKVVCEAPPINPGNSGQGLGLLVAPVKYVQLAHLYLNQSLCLAFCCYLGSWMWTDDWYQFASYLGIPFLATDLITKLLLRKTKKRNAYRPIGIGTFVWDIGCAFPSLKVVFCPWSISASVMKLKKYRDTKKPPCFYMRNISVFQSKCLFSSFFQLYFKKTKMSMIGNYFSTVLLTEAGELKEHVRSSMESCDL